MRADSPWIPVPGQGERGEGVVSCFRAAYVPGPCALLAPPPHSLPLPLRSARASRRVHDPRDTAVDPVTLPLVGPPHAPPPPLPSGLRVPHAAYMIRETQQWIQSHFPWWDRRGGKDHIWLFTHDEGACWVPNEVTPSIWITHWGRWAEEGGGGRAGGRNTGEREAGGKCGPGRGCRPRLPLCSVTATPSLHTLPTPPPHCRMGVNHTSNTAFPGDNYNEEHVSRGRGSEAARRGEG